MRISDWSSDVCSSDLVTYSNNFSVATPTTSHDFMNDGYETARLIDEAFQVTTGNDYIGYSEEDYEELLKRQTDHSLPDVVIQNRNGRDPYVWARNTAWGDYFFRNRMSSLTHSIKFNGTQDKLDFLIAVRF